MSGSKAKVEVLLPSHLLGNDERVWAAEGASTRVDGILINPLGWIESVQGIQPFSEQTANPWTTKPPVSLGTFSHHGSTDLLVNYGEQIDVITGVATRTVINGRTQPQHLNDGYRFMQFGTICIMTNGLDRNLKWDGERVTPLGISDRPEAPVVHFYEDVTANLGLLSTASLLGGTDTGIAKYKFTFVTIYGQESEASPASEAVDTTTATASRFFTIAVRNDQDPLTIAEEVADINVYRSIDEGPYVLLGRLQGPRTQVFHDTAPFDITSTDTLAADGDNEPPPISRFAFPFDGRVYYAGNPDQPSLLSYSRLIDGTPAPEAVSPLNILDVSSSDGDEITGWSVSQDFALIFKNRSIHMLTHDKSRNPVVTPIQAGVGAVNDRAITQLDGKVYFLSHRGLHVFDGANVRDISRTLNERIRLIPRAHLTQSFAWADPEQHRAYFALADQKGPAPTTVMMLHTSLPGVEGISYSDYPAQLTCGHFFKSRSIVGYNTVVPGTVHKIGELLTQYDIDGNQLPFEWQTKWLEFGNPDSTKNFLKMEVLYKQTTTDTVAVTWYTDWDERSEAGADTISLADPNAQIWDSGNWDTALNWDSDRVRTARINLDNVQGRVLALRFSNKVQDRPVKIVGIRFHYVDHGIRTVALDDDANAS